MNLPSSTTTQSNVPFEFTPIEGMLTLAEATQHLVQVAECMQTTHTLDTRLNWYQSKLLFDMRKASVTALLNLIEEYLNQMPNPVSEEESHGKKQGQ